MAGLNTTGTFTIRAANGGDAAAIGIIFASAILSLIFAGYQYLIIRKINLTVDAHKYDKVTDEPTGSQDIVLDGDVGANGSSTAAPPETAQEKLSVISTAIAEGANSFLKAEYKICGVFLVAFAILVLVIVGSAQTCGPEGALINGHGSGSECWALGAFTMIAFIVGGLTSMASGYLGMMIAVYTNVRTTVEATRGWTQAFNSAFRGGAVMGFALSGLGLLFLIILILLFRLQYPATGANENPALTTSYLYLFLFEAIAGYGLGGSSIALFGRVGGGIYTKAADVGADLVGKVEKNIPEDDPRNPATIADNVGDNVGDVAGMGADLFGSFAESTCAALVLSARSLELQANFGSMLFPLVISSVGILVCIVTSFVATHLDKVRKEKDVERVLKLQLILSTIILTPVHAIVAYVFLPDSFCFEGCNRASEVHTWWGAFISLACGLWAGLLTGLITEYYTSHSYRPVREVAESSKTGAATLIIYGLALGYKSAILPTVCLAITVFASFYLVGLYGVALAALGMLSSLSIGLTIDAYGPITDNAGGIAEMAELGEDVRHITDTLDAAGNTTAAIGKGFAIGSAALVSLALFGAFVAQVGETSVNILKPIVFAFLIIGAMLPYWFSALTMKSVGIAAQAMVEEVRDQFRNNPGIMDGSVKPDYDRCIAISTQASLKEMIAPGALVMITPILVGYLFGVFALSGLLAGSLVSSVQMAISSSNTGGAWDNSKKYIEAGALGGKGSDCHKAAVVGDTVGDPLKDTSGPSLNILMKLMAIISLVFATSFKTNALPRGQEWAGY